MKSAVIFGSGKCSPKTKLYSSAYTLGEFLGRYGISIVNGGYYGVMEASAKGASIHNAERIGVIFKKYNSLPNKYISRIVEANSYLERLNILIELGNAFFVFYGGSGTLLELTALLALMERNLIDVNVYCIGKQWKKFLNFYSKMFMGKAQSDLPEGVCYYESVDELIVELTRKWGKV
ncbi:MAG: LOG family protein [Candidatus Kapaibacteriota bacterium]